MQGTQPQRPWQLYDDAYFCPKKARKAAQSYCYGMHNQSLTPTACCHGRWALPAQCNR
jgi:hypothetical protein